MSYQVKIPSCAFGGVGSIEKVKEVDLTFRKEQE